LIQQEGVENKREEKINRHATGQAEHEANPSLLKMAVYLALDLLWVEATCCLLEPQCGTRLPRLHLWAFVGWGVAVFSLP
jgi:hypothetical protein